jgi:hypothetical protein
MSSSGRPAAVHPDLAVHDTLGLATQAELDALGPGGPSRPYLDTLALHATYGDDFETAALAAKWTRRNIVAGNETHQSGGGSYMAVTPATTPADMQYHQPAPAGDFSVILAFSEFYGSALATMFGPMIIDASGNGVAVCFYSTGPTAHFMNLAAYVYTSTGPVIAQDDVTRRAGVPCWCKLRKSGTNYYGSVSHDGFNWFPESSAQAWAGTVNRIGFGRFFGTFLTPFAVDRFNVI